MSTDSRSRSRRRTRQHNNPDDGFMEVRRNGRFLFRIDLQRDLIEIKPKGGQVEIVDLRQLRQNS